MDDEDATFGGNERLNLDASYQQLGTGSGAFSDHLDRYSEEKEDTAYHDEVEFKLNQLLDSYKNTFNSGDGETVYKHREKNDYFAQTSEDLLKSLPDFDTHFLDSTPANFSSTLTPFMVSPPSLPNVSFVKSSPNIGALSFSDYGEIMPPAVDSRVFYENEVFPSDITNDQLKIDESLTFRKVLSTSISGQLAKQISSLLLELSKLKELNIKLTTELKTCKDKLNVARNELALKEAHSKTSSDSGRVAGIVEDIYRAQKTRDAAIMERLKEISHERDAAVMKSSLLHQKLSEGKNDIVSTLIRSKSLDDLRASTNKFIEAVNAERNRKRIANEQEIETILFEKDEIQKKKTELERENNLLHKKLENEVELGKNLKTKQKELEKEKNECLNKLHFLIDKLKRLKISQSLYRSLSREEDVQQQFGKKLVELNEELKLKNKEFLKVNSDKNSLIAKLDGVVSDNKLVSSRCGILEYQLNEERGQNEKLNRLVGVLRKKLAEVSAYKEL